MAVIDEALTAVFGRRVIEMESEYADPCLSADWRALRDFGETAQMPLTAASASAEQVNCRQRIRAGDPPAFSDGIRLTAVTAELMEHYRRQAHVMQNAGPVAAADLIEHYRRQAHTARSAEMGAAISQVVHRLLSGLRRGLTQGRPTK